MHETGVVRVLQTRTGLRGDRDGLGPGQCLALRQGPALDVLHHDERSPFGLAGVVDLHDVRMREAGGEAGLTHEPLAERLLRGEVLRDDFHGDGPVELIVAREVDHGHAAVAEYPFEAVAPGRKRLGQSPSPLPLCLSRPLCLPLSFAGGTQVIRAARSLTVELSSS